MAKNSVTIDKLLSLRYPAMRAPVVLSPDGRLLAVCMQNAYGIGDGQTDGRFGRNGVATEIMGSRIVVVDTVSGTTREPFPPDGLSWAANWSPLGNRLAALVCHEGYPCLATWDAETDSVRLFRDVTVRPNMAFEVPCWTPDGRSVVLRAVDFADPVTAGATEEDGPSVWKHPADPEGVQDEDKTSFRSDLPEHMALVDVQSGNIRHLGSGFLFSLCPVSPAGDSLAILRYTYTDRRTGESYCSLDVISLDGSGTRTVASDIANSYLSSLSWSPDGRRIAYITGAFEAHGRLFVVPADGSSEARELTAGEDVDLRRDGDWILPPCWSADGSRVYCWNRGVLCEARSDGSGIRLIEPQTEWTQGYWLRSPYWGGFVGPDDNSIFLSVSSQGSDRTGIARMDLETGVVTLLQEVKGEPLYPWMQSAATPDASACYLTTVSGDAPATLWRIDMRSGVKQPVPLSPGFSGLALGSKRTIEYQAPSGQTLQAGLLLPPDYQEGQRLPMVVEVYAGSGGPYFLSRLGTASLVVNPHLLAARGYAVLFPQIPLKGDNPYSQIPGPVLAAVDKVVEMGVADPERIGVMGQSYGAYTAFSLITQTPVFRAAVCSNGLVDLVRMYTTFHEQGGGDYTWYCETGQGGMGGTLWDRRDAYIENSPLFHLDKANAAVLLVAGDKDPMGGKHHMQEAFIALRRLGRTTELRMYHGESHYPGIYSAANFRDFCTRLIEWFDLHLAPVQQESSRAEH